MIQTENANKTYHYGRIQADSFTPYPKNPIIANFFNNIGRADELGSGVRNLYKYTKMYSDNEPILFEDDVFKVEIPISAAISTADKPLISVDKPLIKTLSEQEKAIYRYIKENGSISSKLLEIKPTRAREIFNEMISKSLIIPVGERKSRRYVLK